MKSRLVFNQLVLGQISGGKTFLFFVLDFPSQSSYLPLFCSVRSLSGVSHLKLFLPHAELIDRGILGYNVSTIVRDVS